MLLCGGLLLTALAPAASLEFLGSSLTFMMVRVRVWVCIGGR
jgi:hypothetical protein